MMAIAIVILVLGCAMAGAWALRDRTHSAQWHMVGLLFMLLRTEAMKARDQARARIVDERKEHER